MQLTIAAWDDRVVTVHVSSDDTVDTLSAIIEAELGVPAAQQALLLNGQPLRRGQPLAAAGVSENDLIMLMPAEQSAAAGAEPGAGAGGQQRQQAGGAGQGGPPPGMELAADGSAVAPAAFISAVKAQPALLAQVTQGNPRLGKAIRDEDVAAMQDELKAIRAAQSREAERQRQLDELALADPFDPEVQRRIEELIQQKNIEENLEAAMEHSPEVFGQVHMLYVSMEINAVPVKAFIDSGAQMTIMTEAFAHQCGLSRLIDKRFAGMAVGVGSSRILGRVHQAPVKVAGHFITSSVTILEQKSGPQFIFGLDMLRRHQCCIDLNQNVLRFGSVGSTVPFLAEHEIPKDFSGPEAAADGQGTSTTDAASGQHGPPTATAAAGPSSASAPGSQPANPASAAGAAPPAAGAAASGGGAQEAAVQQLMQLGFPREAALRALQAAGGNAEVAASLLFGGMD